MKKLLGLAVIAVCALTLGSMTTSTSHTMASSGNQTIQENIAYTADYDKVLSARYKAKLEKLAAKIAADNAYKALIAPDTAAYPRGTSANLIRRIDTKKPVVFLTIDDGLVKNPAALAYIEEHRLNPTVFLTNDIIKDNYSYFTDYQKAGIEIENHTLTHPKLLALSYAAQKAEICGMSDKIVATYGKKPTIFRPPYGEFNADTLRASQDCGMNYVVHWSAKVDGGAVQYQHGTHLVAGDIVLMHFRPMMMEDLKAFNDEAVSQGLTPAYLSDWLK
jgi:peptidoglycan/xylan/chitin deacetylase (PgdA/CDA1 family)